MLPQWNIEYFNDICYVTTHIKDDVTNESHNMNKIEISSYHILLKLQQSYITN